MYPFERFNETAKTTLALAQDEAVKSGLGYIGTDHLVLGLLTQTDTLAREALSRLGVDVDQVRTVIEGSWPTAASWPTAKPGSQWTIPLSRVKNVIAFAFDAADRNGRSYVSTGHLLIGVLTDGQGVGAEILVGMNATLERAREMVATVMAEGHSIEGSA